MPDLDKPDENGYSAPKIIASDKTISKIKDIDRGAVKIMATLSPVKHRKTNKPYLQLYEAMATDDTGSVRVVWFNLDSVEYLDFSKKYVLLGRLQEFRGNVTLVNPMFTPIEDYEKWVKRLSKS